MKHTLIATSLALVGSVAHAYTLSALLPASNNGSGWTGSSAPTQIISAPSGAAGENEWFSRYAMGNGDAGFNIDASLLAQLKHAPLQQDNGAGLIATGSTVRVSFLGTGAARDSWLFLAHAGNTPFNATDFWAPIYASGGSNQLAGYNPLSSANTLFQTRGGCSYAQAKAGNQCAPGQIGQSREISGLTAGDSLVFGLQASVLHYQADRIHYPDTHYFFSGETINNIDPLGWSDGRIHTKALKLGAGRYLVGFEDSWGGGDQDYNDNLFLFEGVSASVDTPPTGQLPLPGSAGLALLGLGLLGGIQRRR